MASLHRCCSAASTSSACYQHALSQWGRLLRGYATSTSGDQNDDEPTKGDPRSKFPGIMRHFNDNKHTLAANGRAWAASELRLKSFEDLQQIWLLCVREQNHVYTWSAWNRAAQRTTTDPAKQRRNQSSPGGRLKQVKQTMARIKQVLTERAQAEPSERVRKLAMDKVNAR